MRFAFFAIFQCLDYAAKYVKPIYKKDSDIAICPLCHADEDSGCLETCLVSRINAFFEDPDSITYNDFIAMLLEVLNGYSTKDKRKGTLCTLCHNDFEEHSHCCPSRHLHFCFGLNDEIPFSIIEKELFSEQSQIDFNNSLKYLRPIEMSDEMKKIYHCTKRPETVSKRKDIDSRSCRHCNNVFKSISGRKHHERDSVKCNEALNKQN